MPRKFTDMGRVTMSRPANPDGWPADREFPPFLREYLDLLRPIARSSDQYLVLSLLPALSAAVGPRAYIPMGVKGKSFPSISVVLLGPSTVTGKSEATGGALKFTLGEIDRRERRAYEQLVKCYQQKLADWNQGDKKTRGAKPLPPLQYYVLGPEDITSASLTDVLEGQQYKREPEERRGTLLYFDEAKELLAMRDAQYTNGMITRFTKLHDCVPEKSKRRGNRASGEGGLDIFIETPFCPVVSCSTADWFVEGIKGSDVTGGWLARWMVVEQKIEPFLDTPDDPAFAPEPDPEALKQWRERAHKVFYGDVAGPWWPDEEAHHLYETYQRKVSRQYIKTAGVSDAVRAISGRMLENVLRVALLFEAFDCSGRPIKVEGRNVISGTSMQAAIRLCSYVHTGMLAMEGTVLAPASDALEEKYLSYLANGPLKHGDVMRKLCSSVRPRLDIKKAWGIVEKMVELERVVVEEVNEKGKRPFKRHRLRVAEDDLEEGVSPLDLQDVLAPKPELGFVNGKGAHSEAP